MTSNTYIILENPTDENIEAYQPYGAIADLWLCKAHEVIVGGPAETGKTRGALEKLNALLWKYPGAQAGMVRKQYADMPGSCIQTFEKKVLGAWSYENSEFDPTLTPVTKYGGEKPQFYDYPNGSRFWVGGLDRPGKILSSERDFFYINQAEELDLTDWETITTRCTGRAGNAPYSQILGDCNPGARNHWILERANEEKLTLLYSKHEDNPVLFDPETGKLTKQGKITIGILDNLTGVRLQRYRYGKWVSAEGQIHTDYDPSIHLIDPFEIPDSWRRFRCIDFGLKHPFVCGWFAADEDDRLYLYRHIYMTGRTVATHAKHIHKYTLQLMQFWDDLDNDNQQKLVQAMAYTPIDYALISNILNIDIEMAREIQPEKVEDTICDHDAEDRLTLAENGIPNIKAQKDVASGIDKVQDRLKLQKDKRPRLFIFKNSLVEIDQTQKQKKLPYAVEQEFDGYIWANTQKEQPVKKEDDGMDMIRYMVMHLDGASEYRNIEFLGI